MVADVEQLYRGFSDSLKGIVRGGVSVPAAVIDDACQTAWLRLIRRAHQVDAEGVRTWLATTAIREALRLWRREQRELPLDGQADEDGEPRIAATQARPEELAERREQLALVSGLSERQQRLLWMQAAGFSYEEIAAESGLTLRTVERQMLRGRNRLRAAA